MATKKASEKRDISAYACRIMVYGAVSGHGISREQIESICKTYCDANPKVDVTKLPIVMVWEDDAVPERKAMLGLIRDYCQDCSVFSEDGKTALVVGKAAEELVSSLKPKKKDMQTLKTKVRIRCEFPKNRKFKCFCGERIMDRIPQ